MTVRVNKPALNLREEIAKAQSNNADEARIGSLVSDSIDAVAIDAETLSADNATVSGVVKADGIEHLDDPDTYFKFLPDRIYSDVGGNRLLDLQNGSSSLSNAGYVNFKTGGSLTEAARIDASGNLLVGTTSTGNIAFGTGTNVGSFISGSGYLAIQRDSEANIFLSKSTAATNHSFLKMYDNNVLCGEVLGVTSNSITINTGTAGGIYLGGVDASNLLDDYEEGIWTPTPNSGTTSAADGRYTKIGRTVLFEFTVVLAGDATGSTGFSITNLPFASASSTRGTGAIRYTNSNLSNITAHVSTSSNVLSFYQTDGTTLTYTEFGLTNRIDVAGFYTV